MWKKKDIIEAMDRTKKTSTCIKVDFTPQERDEAKALAKSKGMTFQGWLGQLVKRELKKAQEVKG